MKACWTAGQWGLLRAELTGVLKVAMLAPQSAALWAALMEHLTVAEKDDCSADWKERKKDVQMAAWKVCLWAVEMGAHSVETLARNLVAEKADPTACWMAE